MKFFEMLASKSNKKAKRTVVFISYVHYTNVTCFCLHTQVPLHAPASIPQSVREGCS